MMKVKEVSYKRTKNLGNYESVQIGLVVEPDYDETEDRTLLLAKAWVNKKLSEEQ